MGPLIGHWERTPIWLQALGKPPLRRHVVWAHSEEWEYRDAAQVQSMEKEMRGLMAKPAQMKELRP